MKALFLFLMITISGDRFTTWQTPKGGDFKIVKGKTPDDTFVDHTSSVFVLNRKGVWVNSLHYDSTAIEFRDAHHIASRLPP